MQRWLFIVAFTLVIALITVPDLLFGIDRYTPFAQLVSFRPQLLVVLFVICLALGAITLFRRAAWPFATGAVAVLAIGVAMVAPRVVADPLPTTGTPLKVLAFNTYEGNADVAALVATIAATRPDVVSISESGQKFGSRIAALVEPLGYRTHISTERGVADVNGVTALVADRLGDVQARVGKETSSFPYIELTGGELKSLRFVAFHSVAPKLRDVPDWRTDLALLPQWCAGSGPAVVAGDVNATLDHSALRAGMAGCSDAADQRGAGLIPTWGPSPRQRTIGPQIDHVLGTDGVVAESFEVRDLPGSDHRAILTTLRVPG